MSITVAKLKNDPGKYLPLADTEATVIAKNGKTIAKPTSSHQDKLDTVNALYGSVPNTITLDDARKEFLSRNTRLKQI